MLQNASLAKSRHPSTPTSITIKSANESIRELRCTAWQQPKAGAPFLFVKRKGKRKKPLTCFATAAFVLRIGIYKRDAYEFPSAWQGTSAFAPL